MEYLLLFNLLTCALVAYHSRREDEFDPLDIALCALFAFILVPLVILRHLAGHWRARR